MGVGYAVFGVLQRNRLMVAVGAVALVLALGLFLLRAGDGLTEALLALAYVVALLAAHVGWRLTTRPS